MSILIAILIFGFLIFIHELGHYTTARIFGVKIEEFAIGMGPKLASFTSDKTNITYSWRLLPFGGFVSMAGEDEESTDENALNKKPAWQRFIIMIAGSFMNLLLGVIVIAAMVLSSGNLYGTQVDGFPEGTEISETEGVGGMFDGDVIVKIGRHKVHTLYDLSYTIMHDAAKPTDVTVIRNGEKVVLEDFLFPTTESEGHTFGARFFYVGEVTFSFGNVVKQIFYRSLTTVRMIWDSLIDLIVGEYGVKDMSGPVGVTKIISEAAKSSKEDGGQTLMYLVSLIAVNLGVFNLIPFPALDGFRAFLLLIEAVTGLHVSPKTEAYINFAGLALLMLLMVAVSFFDVSKLFG